MSAGDKLQGVHIDEYESGPWPEPGSYWKEGDGWHGRAPDGSFCNLSRHQVTEHDDGTITVSPSIRISDGGGERWHGFLERGVWRQA